MNTFLTEQVGLEFASENSLLAVDLGSAHSKPSGYLGVDIHPADGVDVVCDVTDGLPFEDSSVGLIRAYDFIEHIYDKVSLFNELYRVLAHDGILLSYTPSSDGRGAFQDPTHVAFYNENSFWYFTDEAYRRYVPEIKCNFSVILLETSFPSEFHVRHDIPYVTANLRAVKGRGFDAGPV